MKIIEQSYEILYISEDILQLIENAARTCYKSEDKITGTSAKNFVEMLLKRNHEAMLEFGDIIVKFITDRGISHELVRHRLCSFAQESTRYCNYSKDKFNNEITFIKPDFENKWQEAEWKACCEACEETYLELIQMGVTPQIARSVLPNSLKTEIVTKANIREWRHIFKLRCSKTAHPQIRSLMIQLLNELKIKIPVLFEDIKYE